MAPNFRRKRKDESSAVNSSGDIRNDAAEIGKLLATLDVLPFDTERMSMMAGQAANFGFAGVHVQSGYGYHISVV